MTNLQILISPKADLTKGMGAVNIGSIQSGPIGNVIPDQVNMIGTIRSNSENVGQSILKDLPKMLEHNATANEVKVKVEIAPYAPVTTNNKSLTELMRLTLANMHGEDKLHVLDNNASASEDFAYYGQPMPSLFVFVGATPADQDPANAEPNHNPNFIVDDATLKIGAKAMSVLF